MNDRKSKEIKQTALDKYGLEINDEVFAEDPSEKLNVSALQLLLAKG